MAEIDSQALVNQNTDASTNVQAVDDLLRQTGEIRHLVAQSVERATRKKAPRPTAPDTDAVPAFLRKTD